MPCLFALFTLLTPRLLILVLWFFGHWLRVVPGTLWLVLGFIFLPTTLLWYVAVQHWFGGQWTLCPIVGLVVALMIDVSPASGRRRRSRNRT